VGEGAGVRDYAKIAGTFWTGTTGKALKARGQEAVIVSLYLMSCPNSNMLGLYWLPKMYMAHESGLGFEGASKGLASAIEEGFCRYDEASEVVWVIEMAAWQIGDTLQAADNRCKGVQREYDALPENPYLTEFYERYGTSLCMTSCRGKPKGLRRGSRGATKPRAGTRAGTEAGEPGLLRFPGFWSVWPKSARKGGRAECAEVWAKSGLDAVADAIVAHVTAMSKTSAWTKQAGEFIPAPVVYLRGRRWDGAELGVAAVDDIFAGAK
jgi:hypothetical protein